MSPITYYYNYKLLTGTIEEVNKQMNDLGNAGYSCSEIQQLPFGKIFARMYKSHSAKEAGPFPLHTETPTSNGASI